MLHVFSRIGTEKLPCHPLESSGHSATHTASLETVFASLHIANEVEFISPHSTFKNQSSNVHMRLLWKARSFLPSQWGSSLWGAFCSINYCASMPLLFIGSHLYILDLTLSLQLILIRSSQSSGWNFCFDPPTPPPFLPLFCTQWTKILLFKIQHFALPDRISSASF